MSAEEVLRRYCGTCAHREKCWRPCFTAMAALYTGVETTGHLEAALRQTRESMAGQTGKKEVDT